MQDARLLIVGAGPTGLSLALALTKSGVTPRIIDKNPGPGLQSRAMAVQARTLEFYHQMDLADDVVRRGIKIERGHIHEGGHEVATIEFGDFGAGLSPYPFVLSFPQDEHERILVDRLHREELDVEWNVELTGLQQHGDTVSVGLTGDAGAGVAEYDYVIGCDGAHSAVRSQLRLDFPGGTYQQKFFVADVKASGGATDGDLHICLGTMILVLVFPIRSSGRFRLIGLVPDELTDDSTLTFESVRESVENLVPIHVTDVNWFAAYYVHHRVVDRYRTGNVFVAGDAGHIHSPAGGQGMNTGIGDAFNLAWKLAAVAQARADPSLLDTYEQERIAYARSLVATTDRAFTSLVGQDLRGRLMRDLVIPHLAPMLLGFTAVRHAMFRLLSQTLIHYHESPLSEGEAGHVMGGDRLPWVDNEAGDNFAHLKSMDWQVHVYGDATAPVRDAATEARLAVHSMPYSQSADLAGLLRNALYLVRPDGYVALADPGQDVTRLRAYIRRFRILGRDLEQAGQV